jgi:hypothetical protein
MVLASAMEVEQTCLQKHEGCIVQDWVRYEVLPPLKVVDQAFYYFLEVPVSPVAKPQNY